MKLLAKLRQAIHKSGRPISSIARGAGVSYWPLYRWNAGIYATLDAVTAETVLEHLTGKGA